MKEPLVISRVDDASEKRIACGKTVLEEAIAKASSDPKFFGCVGLQITFQAGKAQFTKLDFSQTIRD